MSEPPVVVRPYRSGDERGWLRCRLLSFFDTCYYDDVHTTRTVFDLPAVELVAEIDDEVVGLLDVEIDGSAATIDCVAVHPDHQRRGVASMLLSAALAALGPEVATLDAWTREDSAALGWYRDHGFELRHQYLHVYKDPDDPAGFQAPAPLAVPVFAFCHAPLAQEAEVRSRFARVYVCSQLLREL